MGKNLRPEHVSFFEARMDEHSKVISFTLVPNDEHYIFDIRRDGNLGRVRVLLSDAYRFTEAHALIMPSGIDFVLMAMPHASFDQDIVDFLRERNVGVGYIGKLMGALNNRRPYEYVEPERRKRGGRASLFDSL